MEWLTKDNFQKLLRYKCMNTIFMFSEVSKGAQPSTSDSAFSGSNDRNKVSSYTETRLQNSRNFVGYDYFTTLSCHLIKYRHQCKHESLVITINHFIHILHSLCDRIIIKQIVRKCFYCLCLILLESMALNL